MLNRTHRLLKIFLFAFAIAVVGCREKGSTKLPESNVKTDEEILFFPTYGRFDQEANVWRLDVHGQVFEPASSSTKRAALIAVLRSAADFSVGADENEVFGDRIRPFLVDSERKKLVIIRIAGEPFLAGTSGANGHFSGSVILRADSPGLTEEASQSLEFEAVLRGGDARAFTGRVQLIAPQGVSVISDIDDTIKHSQVTVKSELLRNTFLREYRAVEGMPKLYASLAESGAAFHYVSGSPWQLYQPLDEFMTSAGFPKGTFHLKQFRLKDSTALDMLSSQQETKVAAITPLLEAFPQRDFILIGDSGEQDPEIYGRCAREHPGRIVGIFIRNVTDANRDDERFTAAFQDVPDDRWTLFDEVSQISEQITMCASTKR